MKRNLFSVLVCSMLLAANSQAKGNGVGLGVIIGEPTGVSVKVLLSNHNAVDFGAAWSFRRDGHFHLHADYLWHFTEAIRASEEFVPFAGIGGRFAAGRGDGILGVRIVGGLSWFPRSSPLEVFVELAPIFDVIPATELNANAGLGIRFFF